MGYVPVTPEELPGFNQLKITAGDHVGKIGCNEMLLYKIPYEQYVILMEENHHFMPLEEEEKFGDVSNMAAQGKNIGSVVGDGYSNLTQHVPPPKF